MNATASGDPMNLNFHSGGANAVIWTNSAGRCGRGRVSARNANFFGSNGDGGSDGLGCVVGDLVVSIERSVSMEGERSMFQELLEVLEYL